MVAAPRINDSRIRAAAIWAFHRLYLLLRHIIARGHGCDGDLHARVFPIQLYPAPVMGCDDFAVIVQYNPAGDKQIIDCLQQVQQVNL